MTRHLSLDYLIIVINANFVLKIKIDHLIAYSELVLSGAGKQTDWVDPLNKRVNFVSALKIV